MQLLKPLTAAVFPLLQTNKGQHREPIPRRSDEVVTMPDINEAGRIPGRSEPTAHR
nr:MAG TPA: hypothetical protein [Caudoviricetes sp.]